MTDEQLMGLVVALTIMVAERDNKRFLRLFAAMMIIFSVWKYGF